MEPLQAKEALAVHPTFCRKNLLQGKERKMSMNTFGSYLCPIEGFMNVVTLHSSTDVDSKLEALFLFKSVISIQNPECEDYSQKETELDFSCDSGAKTSGQQSTFVTLPRVLMVPFKRFRYTPSLQLEKLHYPVELCRGLMVTSRQVQSGSVDGGTMWNTLAGERPWGLKQSRRWSSEKAHCEMNNLLDTIDLCHVLFAKMKKQSGEQITRSDRKKRKATFFQLRQIRCTDTMTQNDVIDVFDEITFTLVINSR
ncbi:ubiquitin carboxyl-terminal hydrolase 37-like isoform X8 [Scomber scombrus]|uniref:Ubiquitin carboxyl-terminal hydrolase 37-like isoform X8 n=1 Tax=Scomber scombrus TaxID=13677 RepID=A0AAV1MYV4_SCOSC